MDTNLHLQSCLLQKNHKEFLSLFWLSRLASITVLFLSGYCRKRDREAYLQSSRKISQCLVKEEWPDITSWYFARLQRKWDSLTDTIKIGRQEASAFQELLQDKWLLALAPQALLSGEISEPFLCQVWCWEWVTSTAEQDLWLNPKWSFLIREMRIVYLLLLKILLQGTVKYNVYFQYIRVKKIQCTVHRSHSLVKHFNGQRMAIFPQALKRKKIRRKIYYCSVGD